MSLASKSEGNGEPISFVTARKTACRGWTRHQRPDSLLASRARSSRTSSHRKLTSWEVDGSTPVAPVSLIPPEMLILPSRRSQEGWSDPRLVLESRSARERGRPGRFAHTDVEGGSSRLPRRRPKSMSIARGAAGRRDEPTTRRPRLHERNAHLLRRHAPREKPALLTSLTSSRSV